LILACRRARVPAGRRLDRAHRTDGAHRTFASIAPTALAARAAPLAARARAHRTVSRAFNAATRAHRPITRALAPLAVATRADRTVTRALAPLSVTTRAHRTIAGSLATLGSPRTPRTVARALTPAALAGHRARAIFPTPRALSARRTLPATRAAVCARATPRISSLTLRSAVRAIGEHASARRVAAALRAPRGALFTRGRPMTRRPLPVGAVGLARTGVTAGLFGTIPGFVLGTRRARAIRTRATVGVGAIRAPTTTRGVGAAALPPAPDVGPISTAATRVGGASFGRPLGSRFFADRLTALGLPLATRGLTRRLASATVAAATASATAVAAAGAPDLRALALVELLLDRLIHRVQLATARLGPEVARLLHRGGATLLATLAQALADGLGVSRIGGRRRRSGGRPTRGRVGPAGAAQRFLGGGIGGDLRRFLLFGTTRFTL
jgi:hypothetical protein